MSEDVRRVSTGLVGLDQVLGGGLLPGSLVFLVGAPGAGKTILAQAIAFQAVSAGDSVLYFTALSEPHSKLITHIRGLPFFDERVIGERLQLLNLGQVLRQGAEETADAIVQMARTSRAGLVVLDGFRSVVDFIGNPIQVRELLYQLTAKLDILGTTCVVTLEAEPRDTALHGELTIADVVIGMWYEPYRVSHTRRIEVLKARGSNPLPGTHSLVIASDAMVCYPQAEMLPIQDAPGVATERAAFGLPGLDVMLAGGLTVGTSTVIAGELGVGKSLLGLTWLVEGARQGQAGLLLTFHESRAQVLDKARVFGMDLTPLLEQGLLDIWSERPVALDPNRIAAGLRSKIVAAGVRRVVIDSERELLQSLEPERIDAYLAALVGYLRGEQVTALVTKDIAVVIGGAMDVSGTSTATLAENLLVLRRYVDGGGLRHAIAVLKMRFSAFDLVPHEYTLTTRGIQVSGEARDLPGALGMGAGTLEAARLRDQRPEVG